MGLSVPGCVANNFWKEITSQFQQVELDAFIVMPNHIHGIIAITGRDAIYGNQNDSDNRGNDLDRGLDAMNRVPTEQSPTEQEQVGSPIYRDPDNSDPDNFPTEQKQVGLPMNHNSKETGQGPTEKDNTTGSVGSPIYRDPDHTSKGGITEKHNPMLYQQHVGKIIRWYKGRCTFEIRKRDYSDFAWQSRFYDHIIRNEKEWQRIRKYIYDNPLRWQADQENSSNEIHEQAVEYMVANE